MGTISAIDQPEQLASLPAGPVEPLEPASFRLTNPAHHLALQDATGRLLARCSLWRARDAHGAPTTAGLIGHYAANDAEAGAELLQHALDRHRAEGCDRVIGPMDGSTWHRYRLLTERGTEPTFFLEPDNPDDWPTHFTDAGFVPLATYTSALNSDLNRIDPRSDQRRAELEHRGITLRPIDVERFDVELAAIHELSLVAFARNFLYSPIGLEAFLASYNPIRHHLVPELVLTRGAGWASSSASSLVFRISWNRRGVSLCARQSSSRWPCIRRSAGIGLGGLLMDDCQRAARKLGFARVIHALMRETNRSRIISSRYGPTIRRYTLYERPLSKR